MGGALRIATIGGIPIHVHASWLLVYALITWTLAVGYFPRALPELGAAAWWVSGLIAALLLFVAVLLHELSHAFVARAHGLRVRGITLHVFGGVSHLEDEPPSPRAEFLIAVVGPLTSLGLAGLLWAVLAAGLVPTGSPAAIVEYLVFVNAAVGVFNLLPGFPLDGGRLLRAGLWRWKGTLARATYLPSRVGTGVAFGLVGLGVLQILAGGLVGGFWLILIGLFLRGAADASYAQLALREALQHLRVRDIMARDVVTVTPEATLEELVEKFWAHHFTSFPVVRDGRVFGIAAVHDLHGVPRERWREARAEEVMRPLGDGLVVAQDDSVVQALQKAAANGLGRLAVLESGRLVGYLSLKDITHVLVLRGGAPLRGEEVDVPSAVRELDRAA
ncbi:MAG TPA: site-2 protease family protein [Candidatus Binatia bacterium]|nr:site-2 protease family protein [Candidatus Binatia bacterium]